MLPFLSQFTVYTDSMIWLVVRLRFFAGVSVERVIRSYERVAGIGECMQLAPFCEKIPEHDKNGARRSFSAVGQWLPAQIMSERPSFARAAERKERVDECDVTANNRAGDANEAANNKR